MSFSYGQPIGIIRHYPCFFSPTASFLYQQLPVKEEPIHSNETLSDWGSETWSNSLLQICRSAVPRLPCYMGIKCLRCVTILFKDILIGFLHEAPERCLSCCRGRAGMNSLLLLRNGDIYFYFSSLPNRIEQADVRPLVWALILTSCCFFWTIQCKDK